MVKKIKVKHSGLIKLKSFDDFPDGNLVIAETKKNVPFAIKRIYYINNLFNKKAKRGHHAHKKLNQIIFCVNGSFVLNLDDGKNKQSLLLNSEAEGVILGPSLWHTMEKFSSDCVILVLADNYYKESDYIRNYEEFLRFVNKK
ncbi:WxcM-like domain-containing protein [Candidatus Falkowbacteria bacterium]|nr:WxcM-like domain-containing protein [Candidatus Falkowbacteria bacterium]